LSAPIRDWSPAVAYRQVTYTNLRPGSYRFSVVASNSAGLWNGQETSVQFTIEPAIWQTWWFRLACLSICALIVAIFYRIRMHRLSQRLDRLFQERLAERTRIAQELHDTLLQSFQGLMYRFQTVEEMLPNRPADARNALEGALDLADRALTEGRDAIRDIRTSPIVSRDLAKALNGLMTDIKEEFNAGKGQLPECSVLAVGRPQAVHPVLRAEILRIAREAIRNAFRHAGASRIEAEITFDESSFGLRLRDDGAGIDPAVLESRRRAGHWGLVGMEERARRVGGQLDLWSKLGAGTELELRIPGHIAYENQPSRKALPIFRRKEHRNRDQ
jgi:signal transduction histidine kinase